MAMVKAGQQGERVQNNHDTTLVNVGEQAN
jgi:hypothetical protein